MTPEDASTSARDLYAALGVARDLLHRRRGHHRRLRERRFLRQRLLAEVVQEVEPSALF